MSKHVEEKCGKLCISNILSPKKGITPSKIDANWRQSNLICSTVKQIHMYVKFQLNMSKHVGKESGKLYFHYFSSKKEQKSYKNWRKLLTLEPDL